MKMKKRIVLIFTLLVIFFGTGSAQQQQFYESVPNQSNSNEKKADRTKPKVALSRFTVNDKFSAGEISNSLKIGALYYGFDVSINFSFNPSVITYYPHATYVYSLNDKLNL